MFHATYKHLLECFEESSAFQTQLDEEHQREFVSKGFLIVSDWKPNNWYQAFQHGLGFGRIVKEKMYYMLDDEVFDEILCKQKELTKEHHYESMTFIEAMIDVLGEYDLTFDDWQEELCRRQFGRSE